MPDRDSGSCRRTIKMASEASDKTGIDRRSFLKGAAAAGAAAAIAGSLAEKAQAQEASDRPQASPKPSAAGGAKPLLSATTISRPGSDFMVDVIKALGIEFVAANPGSSFRSLQESIVN